MSKAMIEMSVEEFLKQYGSEAIEICNRIKGSRYTTFTKVALKNVDQGDAIKAIQESITELKNTTSTLNANTAEIAKNVSNCASKALGTISAVTGVLNLCATVAGFAIISAQINEMNSELKTVMKTVLDTHELDTFYKFDKTVSEYKAMLDGKKINEEFSEEKYRVLIDDEYAILKLFIGCFLRNACNNKEDILYAIVSLSSMMACTIADYDEIYYYKHKEKQKWYSGHDAWMSIYDSLTSIEFKNKLLDYLFLERGFNQYDSDLGVVAFTDNFYEAKQAIADKQRIIELTNSKNEYRELLNRIDKEVLNDVNETYKNLGLSDNKAVCQMIEKTAQTLEMYS